MKKYRPRRRKQSKHRFSKFWVSVLILTILAYVTIALYFAWNEKYIPDSLNYTFLPAIFGQLANMAFIARKGKDVEIAYIQNQPQEYHQNNRGGIL